MSQSASCAEVTPTEVGFGPEVLRLRPRSGYEYAFSGDAPRFVHYALFLALGASAVLGVFLADALGIITPALWYDWWENLRAFAFLAVCVLCGFAVSAGIASGRFISG
jgi:predicted outer membrane lipoprotein